MTSLTEQTVRETVTHLSHFRLLNTEQVEALAAIASIRKFQAGELIFAQGDAASVFYVLLSGKIQIYKLSREGKEMILHLFGAGDLFAEIPVFSGYPHYPANSLCLEDSQVLAIRGAEFRDLVYRFPNLALNMLSIMAQKLHHFNGLIEDLSLRTVESRVAKYLLAVSENSPDKAVIFIHKKTLASILGTIPETLSRAFKKLSNAKLISVQGNQIHLLEREALTELAGSDY